MASHINTTTKCHCKLSNESGHSPAKRCSKLQDLLLKATDLHTLKHGSKLLVTVQNFGETNLSLPKLSRVLPPIKNSWNMSNPLPILVHILCWTVDLTKYYRGRGLVSAGAKCINSVTEFRSWRLMVANKRTRIGLELQQKATQTDQLWLGLMSAVESRLSSLPIKATLVGCDLLDILCFC